MQQDFFANLLRGCRGVLPTSLLQSTRISCAGFCLHSLIGSAKAAQGWGRLYKVTFDQEKPGWLRYLHTKSGAWVAPVSAHQEQGP